MVITGDYASFMIFWKICVNRLLNCFNFGLFGDRISFKNLKKNCYHHFLLPIFYLLQCVTKFIMFATKVWCLIVSNRFALLATNVKCLSGWKCVKAFDSLPLEKWNKYLLPSDKSFSYEYFSDGYN